MPPALIDSHLHVWDPNLLSYPWLSTQTELNRPIGPPDPSGSIAQAIFVEADCAKDQALHEVEWVHGLDWPGLLGIIASARLEHGSSVEADIAAKVERGPVVGIRRLLQDEPAGFIEDRRFVEGLRATERAGLSFDATTRPNQLAELERAHRATPQLVVVLDHLGNPPVSDGLDSDRGKEWLATFNALAAHPNVYTKLSGPVMARGPRGLSFELAALEAFGPDRVMVGSDHPLTISDRTDAYESWALHAGRHYGLTEPEFDAIRGGAARSAYRLAPSLQTAGSISTDGSTK
jgi:L-fuconolactonase